MPLPQQLANTLLIQPSPLDPEPTKDFQISQGQKKYDDNVGCLLLY